MWAGGAGAGERDAGAGGVWVDDASSVCLPARPLFDYLPTLTRTDFCHTNPLLPAALLEQEQWAVVEVPPQFQGITDELQQRGLADAVQAADAGAGLVRSRSSATQAGAAVAAPPIDGSASNGGGLSAAPEGESGTAAPGGPIPRKYTITPHDGTVSSDTQQQQQQHQQPFLAQQEQLQGQQQSPNGVGPARTLVVEGLPFHVVNTELLLLSMLRDYLDFRDAVPAFAAEVGNSGQWMVRRCAAAGHQAICTRGLCRV